MGTWCEDSQREVPGMMKILNQAGFNTAEMEIIAIDEDKRTKEGLENAYNLAYVPVLIFFEGEKEINRIVEFPINSLEQDMLDILSGKEYKNAYAQ
jgi:thiol-disulfide isomerase/thioredoxin